MFNVFIDPGHGSKRFIEGLKHPIIDVGTTGYKNAYNEAAIVLLVGKHVEQLCLSEGWSPTMSRTTNTSGLRLSERGAMAEKHEAHVAVSIHCDAAGPESVFEQRTYYKFGDKVGETLALEILKNAPAPVARKPYPHHACSRVLNKRAYNVMHPHKQPVVLVECGFLTNPRVAEYLTTVRGQFAIAKGIFLGVKSWKESVWDFANTH
jgi:N-acetylmuramoyl-L-alanine amidase